MEMLKKYGPEEYLARLFRTDSKHLFLAFLKKHLGKPGCIISTSELLKLICVNRAVKCATVLLEEDTGLSVDLNVVLEGGFTPLQLAARSLSFPLTELFLRHGALLNHDASKDLSTLPLNLALNALCRHEFVRQWTTKESIYKLFFIFCLQDLKEQLDTIKLLASKTHDLENTFIHHVEGVVQLAALLMVAWDRILPPLVEKGIENSRIAQHIQRQLTVVSNQEVKAWTTLHPNKELLELYKNKKINLLAQWEVLKIPKEVYDVLEKFRLSELPEFVPRHALPFEIGYELYMYAGLVLTPVDVFTTDIKCLLPKLSKEKKDRLNENLEKIMASGPRMPMPKLTLKNGISVNPSFPSMARAFHTYETTPGFNLRTPAPVKSEVPHTIQAVEPFLPKIVQSASICSRLILIGRKCMK